jgi:transposase
MAIKKDKYIKTVSGLQHTIYAEHEKQRIVGELDRGELSIGEACQKYGIHFRGTITNWLKKYSTLERSSYTRVYFDEATRRQIVRQVEGGSLTLEEAIKKYGIIHSKTIKQWIKKYSCQMPGEVKLKQGKDHSADDASAKLLQTIEQLKLRVTGLETMIDLAEKEFRIEIRKKSGTKQ